MVEPTQALIVRVTDPNTGRRLKRIVQRGTRDDGRPETPAQHRQRAANEVAKLLTEIGTGATQRRTVPTLLEYSTRWLNGRTDFKRTTADHYERVIRLYLTPSIGDVPIDRLTIEHVHKLDADMASGDRPKGRTTRGHARTALPVILKSAIEDKLVREVVTRDARKLLNDRPREIDVRRVKALNGGEMQRLIVAARDTRFEALIAVVGLLGLRIGEALGIGWDCVDLQTASCVSAGT